MTQKEDGFTPGEWHVERRHAEGDDPKYDTFNVLAPNPDAGKESVCYAGKYLSVVQCLDSEPDAHLIAAAPDLLEAARSALAWMVGNLHGGEEVAGKLEAAIAKATRKESE